MSADGAPWPPLTEQQEARLERWLEELQPFLAAPVYRHRLAWIVAPESRPGRGHDVQAHYLDGELFACLGMDVYGHGWDAYGTVVVAHNSADEECSCEGCEAEREAEQP